VKIKTKKMPYEKVLALPRPKHKNPRKPGALFRALVRLLARADLKSTRFTYVTERMEEVGDQPALILMNHSSFIDLEIVSRVFSRRPYCIVCTSDGFVGKEWLMRRLGCIPTNKFVSDITLITDIQYALKTLHTSVLMFPEASYSFDGCATPLPRRLGGLLKHLGVPVIHIQTEGAFARDPLYNCLQKRDVKVSATVRCLLTPAEIAAHTVPELDDILDEAFTFDNFRWQYDNRVAIREPFRADGLNRILYRCANCGAEGDMEGRGTTLTCRRCGKQYRLDPFGRLHAKRGKTEFPHTPDWYNWEREVVRKSLLNGTYRLEADVDIGVMVDYRAIYLVGEGHLTHTTEGFHLTGCDGKLDYRQSPLASYCLYSDYYWYEIGDVICIGGRDILYYCFPKGGDVVAKARLAAEELYKITREKHRAGKRTEPEPKH